MERPGEQDRQKRREKAARKQVIQEEFGQDRYSTHMVQLLYEDKSERELAAELGISQKAVNKRRHKILEKLKKFLEKF